jgi:hypothetical protein
MDYSPGQFAANRFAAASLRLTAKRGIVSRLDAAGLVAHPRLSVQILELGES